MEEGEGEEREEKGMIWIVVWMRKELVMGISSQCRRRDLGHWEGAKRDKRSSLGFDGHVQCEVTNCDLMSQSTPGTLKDWSFKNCGLIGSSPAI